MSRDNSQRGVRRTQKIPLSEAEISGPTGRRGGGGGRTEQQLFVKKDRKEVGNDYLYLLDLPENNMMKQEIGLFRVSTDHLIILSAWTMAMIVIMKIFLSF